jgi:thiol-disulfide isomerase/thioredoxin
MKKIVLILFSAIIGVSAWSQGIEFFNGTWDEALAKAQEEDKIIFVDAYASWCGPCKRMAKTVFTQKSVGDLHNTNFINLKLDMEKKESTEFRKKHSVRAYPTLFYLDPKGEKISVQVGGKSAEDLIKLGESALKKYDRSAEYAALYEEGNREPKLVYNYVKALNKSGKSSLKVANEYLKTQEDLTTEFNLNFIYEAASDADSKIFDLLLKNRSAIEAIIGKAEVDAKIEKGCHRSVNKAIEYEVESLYTDAKNIISQHLPSKSKVFNYEADMKYYAATENSKEYIKAVNGYAKAEVGNNASQLHKLAKEIYESFGEDEKALKTAEKYASKAAENGGLCDYYYTYSYLLMKSGKTKEAKEAAEKCKELAQQEKKPIGNIEKLIKKIEQG